MIFHYLKIAFRNLCKHKTQNIISIIGLAVGLLCFCVCIYCSRFVESTDHCFANHDRIAELNLYDGKADRYFSGSPVPLAEELRTWSLGETEAISSVTYPRERPYYVELSPEKTLPYELETIEIANKIDTYETSILPYEDCCTVFLPRFPLIRPQLDKVEKFESKLDVDGLIKEAMSTIEKIKI